MYAERLEINPKQAAVFLGIVVFSLLIADSATLVAKYYFGDNPLLRDLLKLINLNGEKNIPTPFSTVLLLLCSILLSTISTIRIHRRQIAYPWIILASIFLFLAVDEFVGIHERLCRPVKTLLNNPSGAFRFGWVVPYGVFVAVLAATYSRFILGIPPRPRRLMLIAAFVYVTGAFGFEMVEGWYSDLFGTRGDLAYKILTMFEESLEMIGLVTFVYALMVYVENVQEGVAIQIGVTRP